MEKYYRMGK